MSKGAKEFNSGQEVGLLFYLILCENKTDNQYVEEKKAGDLEQNPGDTLTLWQVLELEEY